MAKYFSYETSGGEGLDTYFKNLSEQNSYGKAKLVKGFAKATQKALTPVANSISGGIPTSIGSTYTHHYRRKYPSPTGKGGKRAYTSKRRFTDDEWKQSQGTRYSKTGFRASRPSVKKPTIKRSVVAINPNYKESETALVGAALGAKSVRRANRQGNKKSYGAGAKHLWLASNGTRKRMSKHGALGGAQMNYVNVYNPKMGQKPRRRFKGGKSRFSTNYKNRGSMNATATGRAFYQKLNASQGRIGAMSEQVMGKVVESNLRKLGRNNR